MAIFILLYIPFLGSPALSTIEAVGAVMAERLPTLTNPAVPAWTEQSNNVYPLYALLVRLCALVTGGINEYSTRLPAVLGILGMASLSAFLARREMGRNAALVAFTVCTTMLLCLTAGRQGDGQTVVAFLLSAAWFSWYIYGRQQRRWTAAWIFSLLLVLAAAFQAGLQVFLFFYLPLLFLRRPLRVWKRMITPVHLILLTLALGIFTLWYMIPGSAALVPQRQAVPWVALPAYRSYFQQIFMFPVRCLILSMPWPLLGWPVYCAAFRPLGANPTLGSFLRTLILPLFLLAWFLPGITAEALLPLVCPLAVLTALHYDILIRRHYRRLEQVCRAAYWTALTGAVLGLGMWALHSTRILVILNLPPEILPGSTALLLVVLILSSILITTGTTHHVWLQVCLAVFLWHSVALAVTVPFVVVQRNYARRAGEILAAPVPQSQKVYKLLDLPMLTEMFYLKRDFSEIRDPEELPEHAPVYVVAGPRPPILETRTWKEISNPVSISRNRQIHFNWEPENAMLLEIEFLPATATLDVIGIARTYRGAPRSREFPIDIPNPPTSGRKSEP